VKIWRGHAPGPVPDWQRQQEERNRELGELNERRLAERRREASAQRKAARKQRRAGRKARRAARLARARTAPASLRAPRAGALWAVALLVLASAGVSFAESYRGLYLWAHHHGLSGIWAAVWPCQVDVFIAVGELALFVALADGWKTRSRLAAWAVTGIGLAVSVAGNVGHITSHAVTSRATAAIPPLAAAAALAVGLGVLKRVVENQNRPSAGALWPPVPTDAENAALLALRATLAAGNPLSGRQLETRFGLTRAEATRVRQSVISEANGQEPDDAT
jgi:Protein of unknown function (DUF2637)